MTWITPTPAGRREQLGRFLLGTGGVGGIAGATGPGIGLSEEDGHALIDRAVATGIRVLDTADVYAQGASERIVGAWLAQHPESDVLIQTKTGITAEGIDLSPDRLRRQLAHSVEVLGRVDLYLAHRVDPATPWADSLAVFSEAVENGTIRAYGLSNVDGAELTAALETADRLGFARPEIIQNRYSLLTREDEAEVWPIVRSEGLAYTPFSPLATGLLAGRYSHGEQPAVGSRASVAAPSATLLDDPEAMRKIREFDAIAAETGVSSAGLALAWVITREAVTAPIVGPSREAQWQAIHEAAALNWSDALEAKLDTLFG